MAPAYRIRCPVRCELGEGPRWSARENAVYWVDILGAMLHRFSLADGNTDSWTMPEKRISSVMQQGGAGGTRTLAQSLAGRPLWPLSYFPEMAEAVRAKVPGAEVLAIAADVSREDEAARAVAEALAQFDKLDILVNVAGIRSYEPLAEANVHVLFHAFATGAVMADEQRIDPAVVASLYVQHAEELRCFLLGLLRDGDLLLPLAGSVLQRAFHMLLGFGAVI